ncbi:MAG: glycosyltransferase, partial [Candidatus Hadarchaeales archaeon]
MRICLLSRFFDLRNAGIGGYSMELSKGLKKRGFEVSTVSQDGGIPLGEGSVKYLFYTAFEIAFKIPRGCDVYHACSPMEAVYAPKPLTVCFHDLIPMLYLREVETHYAGGFLREFRRWFGSNYFRKACSTAVKKADAIIAQSEQTKRELVRELGVDEADVRVIRHGIRPDLEPRPKTDDTFRVGTLSYLDPRKRIDLLIKAFRKANIQGELLI